MTPAPIRYLIKSLTLIPILLCRQLSKLMPRDNKRVCIGAWFGNLYADNPKYFTEYLLENSGYDVTWIGNDCVKSALPKHPRLHFARKGSWSATRALLRARFWISCISYVHDLTNLPFDGGAVCISLWHGIPVKKTGRQAAIVQNSKTHVVKGLLVLLEEFYSRIISGEKEWLLVASDGMAKIQLDGYPCNYSKEKILKFGTPRNDFLIRNKNNKALKSSLKEKYAKLIGFNPKEKIILFLPTWRATGKNVFCFFALESETQRKIKELLDNHSAVLIEKHHFHTYELYPRIEHSECSITIDNNIIQQIDAQELLLCADILICDYSGAYVDFGLLERPCINFAYDLDDYTNLDYGLAYNLHDVAAGPLVTTIEELLPALEKALQENKFAPAREYATLVEFERGNSCEKLLGFMLASAK